MTENLVSVIIPCYNSLAYIAETIDSVFNQSYKAIELIVVDDDSTDGSFEYLSGLAKQNLTVVRNPKKGACAARNHGLHLAQGHFVQFLDADDLLSSNKIELQVKALKKYHGAIAVCNTKHFYDTTDNGKITDSEFLYSTENTEEFLLNLYGAFGEQNMVQTSAWLAPKSLLDSSGPWDEMLSKDQDGEYFCRVVTRASRVIYVPGVLNYYRKYVRGSNIASQKQREHIESQFRALDSKSRQFKKLYATKAYNKAMALQYKVLAIEAYPAFKDISYQCIAISKGYGDSSYLPVLGGKIIESFKYIFGWRAAKSISIFVHKHIKKY
jgi:glycosyltransferase involved in cell wall biosynthesis